MIKVSNLVKDFEGFRALDECSLNVEKGSVYGLVGPNGAGKSTLIRHLVGVYRQTSGEIMIDGQSVYENEDIKRRIGYIPDDQFYFPASNVYDMMKFYRSMYRDFDMDKFEKLKEVFSEIDPKRNIRRYSKGMQKQAAIWLMICCRPDVIILDEPVDGLDPVMRRRVWSIIMADVAERETTVLISSHNLRELEDVCDYVGILSHGKMLLERSLSDLQGNISKLQLAFSGDVPEFGGELNVLHKAGTGRIVTLIVRHSSDDALELAAAYCPAVVDCVPLTLEEIFIYEMGGEDYAVKEILL